MGWGFNRLDKKKEIPESGTRFVTSTAVACRREGFFVPDREVDGQQKEASGHLDEIKTPMCYCRLQIADLMQALFPSFSSCARCKMPWSLVRLHITHYSPVAGMFPLCEDCWTELRTPENRLPYYRELFNSWDRLRPVREGDWQVIETAVFCESIPDSVRAQSMAQAN